MEKFKDYFEKKLNEKQNGIVDKDWDRMLDLVLTDKSGEGVAGKITDKDKAVARFIAGLKLIGAKLEYDKDSRYPYGYQLSYHFAAFGNKAIELGATPEEIQELFNKTEVPEKYLKKMKELETKHLNSWVVGSISKAIIKAGYDINFLNKGGDAMTDAGMDAMDRNGRKWTIGYKTEIIIDGYGKMDLNFDAITSEGGETSLTRYVFVDRDYNVLGQREFIAEIMRRIENFKGN